MLRIHQPYIKSNRLRKTFAFASIGVLLLASCVFLASPATYPTSSVSAVGDSRTIHDIENMQDMTQQICSNTDIEDTADLKDSRDTNTYTIYKAADGNCWMGQNLALTGPLTLASGDTDLAAGATWQLPASVGSGGANKDNINTSNTWDTSNYNIVQIRTGSTSLSGWKNGYGNYYSWPAATAGTGTTSVVGKDATASICPKGWKLPVGTTDDYSFQNLYNKGHSSWTTATYNGNSNVLGYYFGSTKTTVYKGANFWPAAGHVFQSSGALVSAGSGGSYWSRRAYSNTNLAYYLNFNSSNVNPQNYDAHYVGFSVRCVAPGGLDKVEKPLFTTSEDTNVNVDVPSILTIDATSGLAETADASKIIEGTATATISSNTEYNVTLHSTQPSLKDPTVTTAEISPVSSSNPVQPGNNSWGFWDGSGSPDAKVYALPITTTAQEFYNSKETITSTDGDPATKHTYYVGISISPSLPSGVYATDVIITASTK